MAASFNNSAFETGVTNRENRRNHPREADTPLKDIRLYFEYEVPNTYWYLYTYADLVVRILQQKQFQCPGYSHIYISIGETEESAIARTYEVEDWFRFGIAMLSKETLLATPVEELEALLLRVIIDGLYDMADLDNLDRQKIDEALRTAAEWGIFHERVVNEKQNRKYLFRITAKPLQGKREEEIFFALTDRDSEQVYKWKFGELSAYFLDGWLFKLNVTNKLIRTKPRANMLLVLKGRKMELELIVEKIKDGSGQLTYEDTVVPVSQEIIDLEKKLGWRQPRDKA